MGCITHQRHILKRDGTNQFNRLPAAFDPSFVKIDEKKSTGDLLQLITNFASQVQFYNRENQQDGDWLAFFEDFSRDNEPHIALMLTFLKLFDEARDHLNEIGKRHLDFYYSQFLQIQQRGAIPDKVHLILETAKNVTQYKLDKGTKFNGGKDKSGKMLVYESEREIVLNKTNIDSLKSVFVDNERQHAVFAAPIANSADGKGKALASVESKWPAFGTPQSGLSPEKRNMVDATTGFAIASPAFYLKEGERTITITLHLTELNDDSGLKLSTLLSRDLSNTLLAFASAEKDWTEALNVGVVYDAANQNLNLTIIAGVDQPPIQAFDKKIHKATFDTSQPVLKILINNNLAKNPYHWLRSLHFDKITINVTVNGVKNLLLQNNLGKLDCEKPFQPFGAFPAKGAAFYVGSNEVFSKKLTALKLNYKWKDLPENTGGFGSYYANYDSRFLNEGFIFGLKALNKGFWASEAEAKTRNLFNLKAISIKTKGRKGRTFYKLFPGEISHHIDVENFGFEQAENFISISKLDNSTKSGFLRMELTGHDFGHKEFPSVYSKQSVIVSKALMDNPDVTPPDLPNPPYTPVMEYVSLDYTCESVIQVNANDTSAGNRFFHIEPFGEAEIGKNEEETNIPLLPQFLKQGYFYVGLKDLKPPQNLSILFQIAEDSADTDKIDDEKQISWSYLGARGWLDFQPNDIISDSTNGFLKTGIIIFNFQKEASDSNLIMPQGMHWLRASYDGDVRGVNQLIGLHSQAIAAVFVDQQNDLSHYGEALQNGSISKLLIQDANIKKITQPFASFDGQMPEAGMNYPTPFYTRVSERLRHKNRAVTIWDIERLVLNHFPNIYKVKALNHSGDKNDIAPGNITVVVIEKIRNKNAVNPLQPKTSRNTLHEIKAYLSDYVSPFVDVFVQNTIYEEIQVDFKVKFKPGFDPGFYLIKLNDEIKQFLSPWAYEEGKDIVFGSIIYKSAIYYFIEKREYVDFLMDFKMSHIKPNWGIGCMEILDDFYVGANDSLFDVDKAEPKTSRSILVSASDHKIGIIGDEFSCK
jgi:hypothetical protein